MMNDHKQKDIAHLGLFAALYLVLDLTLGNLMPGEFGHMFPKMTLILASYYLRLPKAFYLAILTIFLDITIGHVHLEAGMIGFFLDYIFGYSILSLASIFPKQERFKYGIIITYLLHGLALIFSRMLAFKLPFFAAVSLVSPSIILSIIVALILIPQLLSRLKKLQ